MTKRVIVPYILVTTANRSRLLSTTRAGRMQVDLAPHPNEKEMLSAISWLDVKFYWLTLIKRVVLRKTGWVGRQWPELFKMRRRTW